MNELATYLNEKDWANHPLGSSENWPSKLTNSLSIIKESRFPKMILWGDELYCFYNEAYGQSLGADKEQASNLGKPFSEVHPEAVETFLPAINGVLKTGKSTYFEDQLVSIYSNGNTSEAYWTYSHSPLRDANDTIVGIFLECLETASPKVGTISNPRVNQEFKGLSDNLPHPVFATTCDGKLTYCNDSLLEYVGRTFSELQYHGLEMCIPTEDLPNLEPLLLKSRKTGEPFYAEMRIILHDGQIRTFLTNVVPVKNPQGDIQQWIGSAVDIQEMKNLEEKKDIFLSMASHEFKTPVTSIKGYVQLLRKQYGKKEDEFLSESLKIVDSQLNGLTHLIDGMLDLARIKTDNIELNTEYFYCNEIIKKVIEKFAHIHVDHNFSYDDTYNIKVSGDREKLAQVLENFLTNAIKYSPRSTTIKIACEAANGVFRVSVADKGIGISQADSKLIFNRLYRSEGTRQAKFPGLGIGLYIAADIIKQHEGTIGVDSEIGEGSTFFFEIPLISSHKSSETKDKFQQQCQLTASM